jgi:hypothetical protein
MRALILFVLIALAFTANVQNPCEYNLIGAGGAGVAEVDSSTVDTLQPRCTPCPTEGCVGWQLPSDTAYHITFFSPSSPMVSIQFVSECHLLLWDTCMQIFPFNPIVFPPTQLGVILPPNSQVIVCSDIGDTIIIQVKATTPNNFPTYTTPILDLSTCSTPTATTHPIEQPRHYWEFDGVYWNPVEALRPNRMYKAR